MPHLATALTDAPRLLLTTKQAATALALSPRALWGLTRDGQIPCLRIPGRGKARAVRYAVDDLQRWIQRTKDAQMVRPAEAVPEVEIDGVV